MSLSLQIGRSLIVFVLLLRLSLADNSEFSTIQQLNVLNGTTFASSITVDPFDQSFYIYGQFSASQLSLTKFQFNGTQLWQSVFGNQSFVQTGYANTIGVNRPAIDARTGDVFVHGWTTGPFADQVLTPRLGAWNITSSLSVASTAYQWASVAWSPSLGRFLVVCNYNAYGTPVLTSSDGFTWTTIAASAFRFTSVVWAPALSLFVAVASDGYVMTTANGTGGFTQATPTALNAWQSVTWSPELGMLVAVANTGTTFRVMTSFDGATWMLRTAAADLSWQSVCWSAGVGRFVAVAGSGVTNRVMTSDNGIDWTLRAAAADNNWQCVIWAEQLNLFVAVANSGTGNRVMTSPDGLTWTIRRSAADQLWKSVAYAPEIGSLVAISYTGLQVMTSQDGINWAVRTVGTLTTINSVIWVSSLRVFVAVGFTSNRGVTLTMSVNGSLADTPFVARFNGNGGSLVAAKFYETSPGRPGGIAISGNRLYLAGTIACSLAQDFDGYLTAINADDLTTTLWSIQITGGTTADIVSSIDVDRVNGVIFLTGSTTGALDGQTNAGGYDAFISRRNAVNGSLISTRQIGSAGNDYGFNIELDPYRSAVYVIGNAGGSLNSVSLMANAQDEWISAYNSSDLTLTHLWTKIIGGTETSESAYDVSVHPETRNIYVSGSAMNAQPAYYGLRDITLTVFSASGTPIWIKSAGSAADDFAYGSAFTANGVLLIAAQFNGTSSLLAYGSDSDSSYFPPVPPVSRSAISVTTTICYPPMATMISTQTVCTATSTVSVTATSTQRLTSTLTMTACTNTQTLIARETSTTTLFVTATLSQIVPVTFSQCTLLATESVTAIRTALQETATVSATQTVQLRQSVSLIVSQAAELVTIVQTTVPATVTVSSVATASAKQPAAAAAAVSTVVGSTVTVTVVSTVISSATETVVITVQNNEGDKVKFSNDSDNIFSTINTIMIAAGFSVVLIAIMMFTFYMRVKIRILKSNSNQRSSGLIGNLFNQIGGPRDSVREKFVGEYGPLKGESPYSAPFNTLEAKQITRQDSRVHNQNTTIEIAGQAFNSLNQDYYSTTTP